MKIVIGTKSPPKVEAIKSGCEKCVYFEGKNVEIESYKSESSVSDMPLSFDENMLGAKNRANFLKNNGIEADFYIGMEGGTTFIGEKSYLFGVVYILSKNLEEHFGFSNMMEVPKVISRRLYENKEDLGLIQDELSGDVNTGSKNGSFGHWSDDMINRKQIFELAFLGAISPFFNKYYRI